MALKIDPFEQSQIGALEVLLVSDDITNVSADIVVSSDDTELTMGGGVSKRIRQVAGEEPRHELFSRIPGVVGDVIATSAGNLDSNYIFHALVLDRYSADLPDYEIVMSLTMSCLDLASELQQESIALPAIAAGTGRLDPNTAAEAVIEAIEAWTYRGVPSLKQVVIAVVDLNQDVLKAFLSRLMERRIETRYQEEILALKQEILEIKQEVGSEKDSDCFNIAYPIAYLKAKSCVVLRVDDKVATLCSCVEVTVRYLVCVMKVISHENGIGNDDFVDRMGGRMSMGQWVGQLRDYSELWFKFGGKTPMPDLWEVFKKDNGKISNAGTFLNRAVQIRNNLQHPPGGIRPTDAMCNEWSTELIDGLDNLLGIVSRCLPQELAVVRKFNGFIEQDKKKYSLGILQGQNNLFRNIEVETSDPVNEKTVGLWDSKSNTFHSLDPYLKFMDCPTCGTENVFLLDEKKSSQGRWWSFSDRHVIKDALLGV